MREFKIGERDLLASPDEPYPYVLLEPGQTAADVPPETPVGALIVQKA